VASSMAHSEPGPRPTESQLVGRQKEGGGPSGQVPGGQVWHTAVTVVPLVSPSPQVCAGPQEKPQLAQSGAQTSPQQMPDRPFARAQTAPLPTAAQLVPRQPKPSAKAVPGGQEYMLLPASVATQRPYWQELPTGQAVPQKEQLRSLLARSTQIPPQQVPLPMSRVQEAVSPRTEHSLDPPEVPPVAPDVAPPEVEPDVEAPLPPEVPVEVAPASPKGVGQEQAASAETSENQHSHLAEHLCTGCCNIDFSTLGSNEGVKLRRRCGTDGEGARGEAELRGLAMRWCFLLAVLSLGGCCLEVTGASGLVGSRSSSGANSSGAVAGSSSGVGSGSAGTRS